MRSSEEVRTQFSRMYDAMARGDGEMLRGAWSSQEGVLAVGTVPQEFWEGHERIVDIFLTQSEELLGNWTVEGSNPRAYEEGTVGWGMDYPTFRFADGREISLRITAVFRKEDGNWKLVQWHASLGVPNEDTFPELSA